MFMPIVNIVIEKKMREGNTGTKFDILWSRFLF